MGSQIRSERDVVERDLATVEQDWARMVNEARVVESARERREVLGEHLQSARINADQVRKVRQLVEELKEVYRMKQEQIQKWLEVALREAEEFEKEFATGQVPTHEDVEGKLSKAMSFKNDRAKLLMSQVQEVTEEFSEKLKELESAAKHAVELV